MSSQHCHDCNSTTLITTESRIVCHSCGLVHADQIYDYGPTLSDNQGYDTFEPLLENGKLAVDTVKRLKNWLGRDITLQQEMAITDEVERLANELLLYDQKCYPSQYYWAGAIVYARRYDHVTRKQAIEYLYGGFDRGCERVLNLLGNIVQEKKKGGKKPTNGADPRLQKLKNKLNQQHINHYDEYLKKEWLGKILQGETLLNSKTDVKENNFLKKMKVNITKYKRNRKRLLNGGYKKPGKQLLFDKYPDAGKLVLKLYNEGVPGYKISDVLERELLNHVEFEEYYDIVPCSKQTVYNYINEHC